MALSIGDWSTLAELGTIPSDPIERAKWLSGAERSVDYLRSMVNSDEIVIYASFPHVYIRGILAAKEKLSPPDGDDLRRAHLNHAGRWHIEHTIGGGQSPRVSFEQPLAGAGKTLSDGQQLVFIRQMEGADRPSYVELDQRLVHALNVHHVEERHGYCRVDNEGDIETIIRLLEVKETIGGWGTQRAVAVKTGALDEYMAVTGTCLVLKFDFTRFVPTAFHDWHGAQRNQFRTPDLEYDSGVDDGHASFANGWMIYRTGLTKADLIDREQRKWDQNARSYASFIVYDWRHQRIIDCSSHPSASTNYFEPEGDLPFELSPVFFRPDVLARYKADRDKYTITDNSIRCRNAWALRSFDVNSAGQVYAYLHDLSNLPHAEQLYWKSFNEPPKASISERSIKTDFKGEYDLGYDPIISLKIEMENLNRLAPEWWIPRDDELMERVNYPLSSGSTKWADEILNLDQALVEGFRKGTLQSLLNQKGPSPDRNWGSLKLIQEHLIAGGSEAEEAKATTAPLRELHELRNILKAHASSKGRKEAERDALRQHGSYHNHYRDLAARCDASIKRIVSFFGHKPALTHGEPD